MRIEFLETDNRAKAKRLASFEPVKLVKVVGGYMAFESWSDWEVWANQK